MTSFCDRAWSNLPAPEPYLDSDGAFWRKDEPVFGPDRSIVKGGLFEHQRQLLALPNFIKVLVMGYGGGKSLIIGKRMISLALENSPMPVAVVCPSYPMAKLTAIPTLKLLLEGKRQLFGRRFAYSFCGQTPMHFTIRYRGRDATIYVLSSDRPDSLKGSNLAAAALEEPFLQPVEAFEQVIARTRAPGAKHKEILLAGTPEQLNWGYDLCEGKLRDRYDVGVITGSTMMNQALDPEYAETMLKGYDSKAAEAFVHGKFVNLSQGVVYYAFDRGEHVVDRERPSGSKLGIGMDFNVNPMACCVFWWRGDEMHFLADYEFPNSDTEFACQVLREEWGDDLQDVFPDASGKARATNAPGGRSDFTILREQGLTVHARSSNPSIRDRNNAANGKFKPAKGRNSITVSPSCVRLCEYFERYTHEERNSKTMVKMSHLLDAATYPIAFLWPTSRREIKQVAIDGA